MFNKGIRIEDMGMLEKSIRIEVMGMLEKKRKWACWKRIGNGYVRKEHEH